MCWKKKDGCGAKFADEDKKLVEQGGVINSNKVWDLHHTILSQAQKRPYVRAVRNATGTSNIFTDEDVPPDDDGPGQAGTAHQRTQTKATSTPKATAIQVRDLNEALRLSELAPANTENMAKADREAATRKLWMEWVNDMLKDAGKPAVASMSELAPEDCATLIAAAKEKRLPKDWT